MCGRVIQKALANAVANAYEATMEEEATLFHPRERTPGETMLSIVDGEQERAATTIRWGLPAAWLPAGELLRHARAESALIKTTFRDAAKARRCVVPVDAWFERGTRPGAGRGPHRIGACDGSITGLAALWWPSAVRGSPRRLVVVTKQASGAPAQIHHRTPMAVLHADVDAWLDAESEIDIVRRLLARPSTEEGGFEVRPQ